MRFFPRDSLRVRLVWQLLAAQAVIIVLLAALLTGIILRTDLRGMLIDPDAVDIAVRAIGYSDGHLVLRQTQELRELQASTPGYWFIARGPNGDIIETGPVPQVYRDLAQHLDLINFVDVREREAPYTLSSVGRKVEASFGEFDVLTGGVSLIETSFALMGLSYSLLGLILVLIALISLVIIPMIVSRAFKGLSAAADEAKGIDIDRRGGRLAHKDVPSEVRPLVHAVNDALARLDQGYERHRRFILDAAHELRTPIAILQTRIESMPPGKLQARLLADAARIAALAEQLLDLQRLERKDETFALVDLVGLCGNVAAELAPLAIASGYHLSLASEEEIVFVSGSTGSLERAVINLVQNAIDHGGQRGNININVRRNGTIEVSDDGPGIPMEEREQIFEPFYRLHPRERGAGLGLNLVREVMRHHGGHVAASDSATGGAKFQLVLPSSEWAPRWTRDETQAASP